jgi:hypothetical protein
MRVQFVARMSAALLLFVSLSASAQLQNGGTYILQGATGRNLSLGGTQGLLMSTNTAGWEQWRYVSGAEGAYLLSFRGTTLIIEPGAGVYHAPQHAPLDLPGFRIDGVEVRKLPDGTSIGVPTAPVIGKPMTIARTVGPSTALLADASSSATPVMHLQSIVNGAAVSYPSQWWTLVPVPSPDMTRQAATQQAAVSGRFYVQSAHGTFLREGTFSAAGTTSRNFIPDAFYPAIQGPKGAHPNISILDTTSSLWGIPLKYETRITIEVTSVTYPQIHSYYLSPGGGRAGSFSLQTAIARSTTDLWEFMDPTEANPFPFRIALGKKILLRHLTANTQLSAEPGLPQLVLSPNKADWEQWTLSSR